MHYTCILQYAIAAINVLSMYFIDHNAKEREDFRYNGYSLFRAVFEVLK